MSQACAPNTIDFIYIICEKGIIIALGELKNYHENYVYCAIRGILINLYGIDALS